MQDRLPRSITPISPPGLPGCQWRAGAGGLRRPVAVRCWMVGGPWASVECAQSIWRTCCGATMASAGGGSMAAGAEAEVFIGARARAVGHHINISRLAIHPKTRARAEQRCWRTSCRWRAIHCKRYRLERRGDAALYEHHRFSGRTGHRVDQDRRGRVFYKAGDLTALIQLRSTAGTCRWAASRTRAKSGPMPPAAEQRPADRRGRSARLHITITGQEGMSWSSKTATIRRARMSTCGPSAQSTTC